MWYAGPMESRQQAGRQRLDRLIRKADSVLEWPLDSVEVVREGRTVNKLASLMDNPSHPPVGYHH